MVRKVLFWVLLSIGLILILGVVLIIHKVIKDDNTFMKYASIDKITYSDTINESYSKELQFPKSYVISTAVNSNTREPIDVFSVNSSTACFVYQMPVKSSAPIAKVLKVQHESRFQKVVDCYGIPFPSVISNCNYQIGYKQGPPVSGDCIVLTTDAQNLKLVEKSDTVYKYIGQF